MRGRRIFWGAVLLQVLVLVGMMAMHGYTLATGTPIRLETAPIDPWDAFRGEYVTLQYKISQLQASEVKIDPGKYRRGENVYVLLVPDQSHWKAVRVSDEAPSPGKGEVVIRGIANWVNRDEMEGPNKEDEPFTPRAISVRYGIEQYYVPQGEGRALEQKRPEMTVEVKVDSSGRAAMSRLFIGDKEVNFR